MKNFPVKVDGKEYWISRSTAVVCVIYKIDENGNRFVAVGKRGKGCPDEVGKWNLFCGYIEWNETIKEACSREIKEECGLDIPSNAWKLISVNSNPKSDKRQNITFRMVTKYRPEYGTEFTTKFSEPDEVEEVRWVGIKDIGKLDWAFNHHTLVEAFLRGKTIEKIEKKFG